MEMDIGHYAAGDDATGDDTGDDDADEDGDDDDEFGEPREFSSKVAVKKISEDLINDIMTTW